jgi:hypothetical protein
MPVLNTADAIYVGAEPADRAHLGAALVWPPVTWGPGERMLDPAVVPPTTYTGDYTTGALFTVMADGRITHLCNRNYDLTTAARLKLWDDATRTLLADVRAPTYYGWQDVPLPTPVEVSAGRKYMVSFHADGEQATTYPYKDGPPVSLSPNLVDMRGTYQGGQTYPFYDGDQYYWLDVIYQKKDGPPGWDPDTQAYLDATGLDASYAPALDGLVTGLKAAGLWTKMRAVYPFIGGTAALHRWNLLDPRDADDAYRLTYTNGPTVSHSTALGYRANAQGQGKGGGYADTHLIPQARLLDVNSTHLAFYGLEDTPPADRAEMGNFAYSSGNARFHVISRYEGVNAFYYGQSEAGATNVPVPAASGLFVATRTGPANQSAYRNGVLLASDGSAPSAGLPPLSVLVGAISGFPNCTDIPCGFASIGSGLAAQDVADLNRVVTDYQTALNRRPVLTGYW